MGGTPKGVPPFFGEKKLSTDLFVSLDNWVTKGVIGMTTAVEILEKHGWHQDRWEKCSGCGGITQVFLNPEKENEKVEITCCGAIFHFHSKDFECEVCACGVSTEGIRT